MAQTISNIYSGLKTTKDLTKFALMRGVPDFSNLAQFNYFESGYSFLIVTEIPKYLEELAKQNEDYQKMIDTYKHVLEYEFKGLDGFEDMSVDTGTITNGISELNVITKVNWQSASQFQLRYQEKSGSLLTKVNELFLRGIKDPRTQVKTYNGLLRSQNGGTPVMAEAGYEYETFKFLYFVTDNTLLNIEKAFYIVSAQPTSAELSIYNSEKGQIEFKEVGMTFNGFPITGQAVTAKAREFLDFINATTQFEESKMNYKSLSEIPSPKLA